jgi:hypothetical protein
MVPHPSAMRGLGTSLLTTTYMGTYYNLYGNFSWGVTSVGWYC